MIIGLRTAKSAPNLTMASAFRSILTATFVCGAIRGLPEGSVDCSWTTFGKNKIKLAIITIKNKTRYFDFKICNLGSPEILATGYHATHEVRGVADAVFVQRTSLL